MKGLTMCVCEAHHRSGVRCSCDCPQHEGIRQHYADLDEYDRTHPKEVTTGNEIDPEGINHPEHYNVHPSRVECIKIVRHMGFNLGNVVKYLWRDGIKDTEVPLQDLKKAAWYLNDEISRRENRV